MIKLTLTGNTYGIKETLKGLGFKWNKRGWVKLFEDVDMDKADELAHRWNKEGVNAEIEITN